MELLHLKEERIGKHYLRVAVAMVAAMVREHPQVAKKTIINPLLQPLLDCVEHQGKYVLLPPGLERDTLKDAPIFQHRVLFLGGGDQLMH